MANSPTVSPDCLLRGAIFALEQCGLLLHDAVALYARGSYATAIVLTELAREELGQYRMLCDRRKRVVEQGEKFSSKELRELCSDHEEKQWWGQTSVLQRTEGGDRLAELLRARQHNPVGSEEYKKADEELEAITKKRTKQIPGERHRRRMAALYVDLDEAATGWRLPRQMPKEKAASELNHAISDYSLVLGNLQPEMLPCLEPDFASALVAWTERPTLPARPASV